MCETLLSQTGLVSELDRTAIVLQSESQVSDSITATLLRRQPDLMAIPYCAYLAYSNRKIAIGTEIRRPSEAFGRKLQAYEPIRTALQIQRLSLAVEPDRNLLKLPIRGSVRPKQRVEDIGEIGQV